MELNIPPTQSIHRPIEPPQPPIMRDEDFFDSLNTAANDAAANFPQNDPTVPADSITPQLVHSWQHSIEALGETVTNIANGYFEMKSLEGNRQERIESTKMQFSFRAFRMRFWAAIFIALSCLGTLVYLSVNEIGTSIVPFLVAIATIAGNFVFRESGLFSSQAKNERSSDESPTDDK